MQYCLKYLQDMGDGIMVYTQPLDKKHTFYYINALLMECFLHRSMMLPLGHQLTVHHPVEININNKFNSDKV